MFPTGAKEEWEKCAIELSTAKLTVWKLRHLNLSSPHSFLVLHPPAPADSSVRNGINTLAHAVCVPVSVYQSVHLLVSVSHLSIYSIYCIWLSVCQAVSCIFLPSFLSFFLSHSSSVSISGSCKLCFYSRRLWITLLLFLSLPSSHSLCHQMCYTMFCLYHWKKKSC